MMVVNSSKQFIRVLNEPELCRLQFVLCRCNKHRLSKMIIFHSFLMFTTTTIKSRIFQPFIILFTIPVLNLTKASFWMPCITITYEIFCSLHDRLLWQSLLLFYTSFYEHNSNWAPNRQTGFVIFRSLEIKVS